MSLSSRFVNFLRPHKTIPNTPWRAESRWDLSVSRVSILFFGLFIFGIGDSLLIQSNLGNAPWSVLAQGLAKTFSSEIGLLTFVISAIVLLLWVPLKEKPGFGTVSNIVIIAAAIQLGIDFIPPADNAVIGLIYVFLGIALVGAGSSLYITSGSKCAYSTLVNRIRFSASEGLGTSLCSWFAADWSSNWWCVASRRET